MAAAEDRPAAGQTPDVGRSSAPRRKLPIRWAWGTALALTGVTAGLLVIGQPGHEPQAPVGLTGFWGLNWHDEFDGASLDRDIWQPNRFAQDTAAPFNPSKEAAWFSSSNVEVAEGNLVLTVRGEAKTVDGVDYPLSSGVVQTTEAFQVRPGSYVEARVQVPACDGCWPALWQVPHDRWPPEIDNFEYFDSGKDSRPTFNYHAPSGRQAGPTEFGDEQTDYRGAFHVYGLWWDGETAVPYLDGRAYPDVAATQSMTSLPLTMIINLSVKAGHQPPDGSHLLVDWVRVWTR